MGGSKKTTEKKYQPPSWVENASRQAVGLGSKIGNQQYEAYSGERVAALSDNERQGMDLASRSAGSFDPYAAQSEAMLQRGTQNFTDADMTGYMNPYIKSALDPAAREIGEAGARRQNELKSQEASMGAWGSRGALLQAQNAEKTDRSIGDLYKTGMSDAFDRATSLWGADRAREMQAAGQFMDLGSAVKNAQNSDITALMTTGATDRVIQQAMKDFDYQQFTEGRDWDMRNLSGLLSAIQGTKGSYTETNTTTEKGGGNALGQVLGIAATVAGAFFTGGASLAVTAGLGAAGGALSGAPGHSANDAIAAGVS